jgi:hypothetical protein
MATISKPPLSQSKERLIVYQHSDLLYWWVVWAYGIVCAALTYLQGVPVTLVPGKKAVLVHPSAWVGISFVAITLFVLIFTNARARGVKSLVLVLFLAVVGLGVQLVWGWEVVFEPLTLMRVHMNLAFYILFSGVLLVAWLLVILVGDRFTYMEFSPGAIAERVRFSEGGSNYVAVQVQTARQSDDILVHKVLGLGILGFGTGDIDVRFSTPGGERNYHMKNVWNAYKVEREINRLVARDAV